MTTSALPAAVTASDEDGAPPHVRTVAPTLKASITLAARWLWVLAAGLGIYGIIHAASADTTDIAAIDAARQLLEVVVSALLTLATVLLLRVAKVRRDVRQRI